LRACKDRGAARDDGQRINPILEALADAVTEASEALTSDR